jgi:hypothetical protein
MTVEAAIQLPQATDVDEKRIARAQPNGSGQWFTLVRTLYGLAHFGLFLYLEVLPHLCYNTK